MGRNDEYGFNVSNPFENKSGKAYDQDTDIDFVFEKKNREGSENYDVYKEYIRQYENGEYKRDDIRSKSDGYRDEDDAIELSSYSVKPKGRKKSKKSKKKAVIITVCSVLALLGIATYIIWPFLHYNRRKISQKPQDLGFDKVINEKIVNIALFGLDTREKNSFEGRSDSIMILSLNTETKTVKVISLMRDTIVKIENNGERYYSKINAAYQDGGPQLAVKTINQNFDLDISNYATINFYGMVDIIDAVGGIDATITEDELEWHGWDNPNLNNCMDEICVAKGLDANKYYINSTGFQHLNGVQAVAYSRVRHCLSSFGTNDDYGRTDRQRHVMQQLFTSAIKLGKSQYIKLANALLPCSETSLGIDDILSLAFDVLLKHPSFEQYRIPQTEWIIPFDYVGYGSCVYFDMNYATRALHSIIYDGLTIEQFTEQHPVEKNDWFSVIGVKNPDENTASEPSDDPGDTSSASPGEEPGNTVSTTPGEDPGDTSSATPPGEVGNQTGGDTPSDDDNDEDTNVGSTS